MRSSRKSVYSKICKRHQFCEKSRRNVVAANSEICKCKCQRQQPVQRMPSFRSGSHPTSKLLHVCFDKIVISVIIQLFKICTFTVSFWLATSQSCFVVREREREGRFWWRCCCCWVATKALSLWSCYTSSQLQLLPHPWGHHIQEM